MMNEITRLDVEIAIARLDVVLAGMQAVRDSDAIWKEPPMIGRVDRIWKAVEELQYELDNLI